MEINRLLVAEETGLRWRLIMTESGLNISDGVGFVWHIFCSPLITDDLHIPLQTWLSDACVKVYL